MAAILVSKSDGQAAFFFFSSLFLSFSFFCLNNLHNYFNWHEVCKVVE